MESEALTQKERLELTEWMFEVANFIITFS
jgi:hypothetical protein